MVKDNLKNAMQYAGLSQRIGAALEYVTSHDMDALTERLELDGKNLYILPQTPTLKSPENAKWEAHHYYADIQIVLHGEELMGYAPIDALTEKTAYNPEKDVTFYSGEGSMLRFTNGDFAIFFPQDVHMPCVRPEGGNESVKKLVIKVRL